MDIQKLVNVMNDQSKRERANYHVCLGDLISALEGAGDLPVRFDRGGFPADPHSYRGHYSDLALEPTQQPIKSKELLSDLKKVLGTELTGYKGGEYLMDHKTPLWRAEYGDWGEAIMQVVVEPDEIVLETKKIED